MADSRARSTSTCSRSGCRCPASSRSCIGSAARCCSWSAFRCCSAAVAASLASPESFAALQAAFAHPLAKLVAARASLWAYLHHFCAGIRYLLLDLHIGHRPRAGAPVERRRRWSVSLALTLIVGGAAMVTAARTSSAPTTGSRDWLVQRITAVRHGALHAAACSAIAAVERRPRLRAVEGAVRAAARSGSRRSCSWSRCSTTRGSACATSPWTTSSRVGVRLALRGASTVVAARRLPRLDDPDALGRDAQ